MISGILLVIITIFLPPLGVFLIAGCGADILINILLTCLGYFPGHIHAFYLEYVYYKRRDEIAAGRIDGGRPPGGVYSQNVINGGQQQGYGGQHGGYGQQGVYGQQGAYGTMGGGPVR
ncbi:hypothetical protein LTR91_013732 [Friedmanniomyces endolithicus]|uniref:Plasma membrane proteolipid 3 n=1 Tax=Friedmanniomyces endolithicus TaxID=329885 RepID=A0AAN6QP72_9PEZI|nr:hypothetical protein LTR94_003720 [Friedmanniomyces endolithicus]KAK0786910.1 hypothetical protein LTR59_010550 [Friedmanniomyces endolithicus]KAK0814053.1 hypothetical protein LTR38_002828 [Friedmanniomyces endolithicus]KAK0857878.1 hypothetical protein LTR03_000444 [Friedmanniomyces endolithicus]KAK0865718.1 hypothetical protein LTS02_005183 [Friedmanniomyces endolithicus]